MDQFIFPLIARYSGERMSLEDVSHIPDAFPGGIGLFQGYTETTNLAELAELQTGANRRKPHSQPNRYLIRKGGEFRYIEGGVSWLSRLEG